MQNSGGAECPRLRPLGGALGAAVSLELDRPGATCCGGPPKGRGRNGKPPPPLAHQAPRSWRSHRTPGRAAGARAAVVLHVVVSQHGPAVPPLPTRVVRENAASGVRQGATAWPWLLVSHLGASSPPSVVLRARRRAGPSCPPLNSCSGVIRDAAGPAPNRCLVPAAELVQRRVRCAPASSGHVLCCRAAERGSRLEAVVCGRASSAAGSGVVRAKRGICSGLGQCSRSRPRAAPRVQP